MSVVLSQDLIAGHLMCPGNEVIVMQIHPETIYVGCLFLDWPERVREEVS